MHGMSQFKFNLIFELKSTYVYVQIYFYVHMHKFCIYNCSESILSRLEIVGPIPLDDSHRFLVLMSSGLCKALQEVHNNEEQNINRELVQSIVHCFRIKPTLGVVAQSVVEKIMSQHLAHYMQRTNDLQFRNRPDMTLMIRNFNYPMPNEIRPQQNKVEYAQNLPQFQFIIETICCLCF